MARRLLILFASALMLQTASGQSAHAQDASPEAVQLPAQIIDLFPYAAGPRFESRPLSPVIPAAQAPQLPSVSPLAISGDFVPDEVLVTIEGGTDQAAALAAAFGLEVRSLRSSRLLGTTYARLGIPDGRSVGTALSLQLARQPRWHGPGR